MNLFKTFKTVYSENKTYLKFSLGKREEINYSQVQMFDDEIFSQYMLPFRCTKTSSTNNIIWDVSGLTSLSEYIKTEMEQSQYFDIIQDIQKIIAFCEKKHLSHDNLIFNPKYMYYHNTRKKVYMIYFPLKNSHYICDDIPKCLMKIHKNAGNVIITDGNYLNRYESYLQQFIPVGRKGGAASFSHDSLRHFFNENNIVEKEENNNPAESVQVNRGGYSINDQLAQPQKISDIPQETESSGTIIINPRKAEVAEPQPKPQVECNGAYLIDTKGRRYDIHKFTYTIGRNANNDLVVNNPTVSGSHAIISKENDDYYITDKSANGTFINNFDPDNTPPSIKREKLNDGDSIYFYNERYIFGIENTSKESTKTVMVARHSPTVQPEIQPKTVETPSQELLQIPQPKSEEISPQKAEAYIKKASDSTIIRVMKYPFTSEFLRGIEIYKKSMSEICIRNISCQILELENIPIEIGESTEIFSGCILTINSEKYMFIIEN